MKKTNYFIYAILLFSLMLSGNVYANSTGLFPDIFEPQAKNTDYLINNILMPIFGYGKGIDYEGNPFGLFSSIFLSGLIVLAAILTIYTVVTGMMDTANSGLLLKNKSSLSWTTLRSVTGVGLLIPLGKSGFCAIQYIVLWIAVQGVLFADSAWERFMSNPFEGNVQQTSLLKRQLLEHSQKIFLAKLCIKINNESQHSLMANGETMQWGMVKDTSTEISPLKKIKGDGEFIATWDEYKFGVINSDNSDHKSVCGIIHHDENDTEHKSSLALFGNAEDSEKTDLLLTKNVNAAHYNQMKAWIEGDEIDKIVDRYIADDSNKANSEAQIISNLNSSFQTLIDNYYKKIYEVAIASKKDTVETEKLKKLKEEGFAAAGTWFFRLASDLNILSSSIHSTSYVAYDEDPLNVIQDSVDRHIDGSVDVKKPPLEKLNEEKFNSIKKAVARMIVSVKKINVSPNPSKEQMFSDEGGKDELERTLKKLGFQESVNKFNEYLKDGKINKNSNQSDGGFAGHEHLFQTKVRVGNPLIQIQSLGNTLTNIVSTIMIAVIFAKSAAQTTKDSIWTTITEIVVVGSIAKATANIIIAFAPFIVVLATSIFLPAIMMAFYVPLIPFILWMGALFGWLVLVVEALFGAPMWAVTFLAPDTNGFVGKQGQGYMLILTLFLRPVLMVLGFIAALHLLTPVVDMLNYFFLEASEMVRNRTSLITWLLSFVALLIIYYITINKTVVQVFSLIHKVPDTLLQWIGGGHSQILGQYAEGVEKGVSNASLTAMAGANSAIHRLGDMAQRNLMNKDPNNPNNGKDLPGSNINKFLDNGIVGMKGDAGLTDYRDELNKQAAKDRVTGNNSPAAAENRENLAKANKDLTLDKANKLDDAIKNEIPEMEKALETGQFNGRKLTKGEKKEIKENLDKAKAFQNELSNMKNGGEKFEGDRIVGTNNKGEQIDLPINESNFQQVIMDAVKNKKIEGGGYRITTPKMESSTKVDENDYT